MSVNLCLKKYQTTLTFSLIHIYLNKGPFAKRFLKNTFFGTFSLKECHHASQKKIQWSQISLSMVKPQYQLRAYIVCTFDTIFCCSNCKYTAAEFFQKISTFSYFMKIQILTQFFVLKYHMVCYFINLKHVPTW